MTWKY